MPSKKLTKKTIDASRYEGDGKSRDVRWDAEIPGLGLRLYPSGRKAFVLSYRSSGRKRLMTLEHFPITHGHSRQQRNSFRIPLA